MAATGTPTPNLGLRIPVGTDPASIDDINYNSNLLDTKLGAIGNDSVQDQLDGLSDQIATKSVIKYVDINTVNDYGVQVNSASGGKINWENFINGYVINSNSLVAVFYTYSNLIYARIKNVETMQNHVEGNYTVRCWYKES